MNTGASSAGAFSTGQTLPVGANATTAGQATPSNQFDAAALSFLTSLQDAGSSAAQELTSSGDLSTTAENAVQQGLGDLTSIVDKLEQALTGAGSSSTSSATPSSIASMAASDLTNLASTASAAASALTSGTPTSAVQALSDLASTLQSLGLGGHHHHHHWGGDSWWNNGSNGASSGSGSGANSGTGTASVAATTSASGATG